MTTLLTTSILGAVLAGGHLGRVGQWTRASSDPRGLRWHVVAARIAMAATSTAAIGAAVLPDLGEGELVEGIARACRLLSVVGAVTAGVSATAVGFSEFGIRSALEV